MRDELPALPDATVEAAVQALAPDLGVRCSECAGTGTRLVSNLDCLSCDRGIRRGLDARAREAAQRALDAARDPALGPDRLVLGRELDEAHQCIAELGAKYMKSFVGMWTTAVAVERDEARAEVARLRAGLGEAADKLETYATWVVEPDRHAKMLRAARRAREGTDAPQ